MTKKNGKSHFGYKAHVAVDEGSEIIRTAILTAADLHDSRPAAHLIRGDEHAMATRPTPRKACATDWPTPASTTA